MDMNRPDSGAMVASIMGALMQGFAARQQRKFGIKREDELRLEQQKRQDQLIARQDQLIAQGQTREDEVYERRRADTVADIAGGREFATAERLAGEASARENREDMQAFQLQRDTVSFVRMGGESDKEHGRRVQLLDRRADIEKEMAAADHMRRKDLMHEKQSIDLELMSIQHRYSKEDRIDTQGFIKSERESGQDYGTSEREARQEYGTGERIGGQQHEALMQSFQFNQRNKEAEAGRTHDITKMGLGFGMENVRREEDRTQRWGEIGFAHKAAGEATDKAFDNKMKLLGAQYGYDIKMLGAKVAAIPKQPANPENIQAMYRNFGPGDVAAVAELMDQGGFSIHEAARIQGGEVALAEVHINKKIASNLQSIGKGFGDKVFDSDEVMSILMEAGIAPDSIKTGASYSVDQLMREVAKSIDSPDNLLSVDGVLGRLQAGIYAQLYNTQFGEDPPSGWGKFKDILWKTPEEKRAERNR